MVSVGSTRTTAKRIYGNHKRSGKPTAFANSLAVTEWEVVGDNHAVRRNKYMVIMMKAPCKCGEWERVTLRNGATKTGEYFYVSCPRCGRQGLKENSREEAVKDWNRKMGGVQVDAG